MEGWIKLHRYLLEKAIWENSTPEQKTILITLLLLVNSDEKEWEWEGKKFSLAPGQKITSLEKIAQVCGKGITIQNVRTALKRFEKLGFLTNQSTKTGRLITIVNWGIYQSKNESINKEPNKELTNSQQTPNKDLTPNKNNIYMPVSTETSDGAKQQVEECAKTATEKKTSALTVGKLVGDYPDAFKEFWSAYPAERRVEKKAAFKCWKARIKSGVPPDDLITAAKSYAESVMAARTEPRFIKQPKTFIGSNEPYKEYLAKAKDQEPVECEILGTKVRYDSDRQVWVHKGTGYKYKTDLEQAIREEGDDNDKNTTT